MSTRYVMSLNNYLQSQGGASEAAALSWEESTSGPPHGVQWTVVCKVRGRVLGTATASQKSAAKESAAKQALQMLGVLV